MAVNHTSNQKQNSHRQNECRKNHSITHMRERIKHVIIR